MADKKKDKKTVEILEVDIDMDAIDDDWMRAGRLREKAEAGDTEARAELAEMKRTKMVKGK